MKKKLATSSLLFLTTSFVILLVSFFFELPFASGAVQTVFARPLAFLYGSRISPQSQDIEKLQQQNRDLTLKLAQFQQMEMDNTALRSQFDESTISDSQLLPARVVGFEGKYNSPHTLVINQGKNSAVRVGAPVVFENFLVGEIASVSDTFSTVQLPTHSSFSTVGKVVDGGATGVVRGADDFIVLERVVITDSIKNGSIIGTKGDVASSGIGIIPDLIIGKVVSIDKQESEPFQSAKVESMVEYSRLTTVFVIRQ